VVGLATFPANSEITPQTLVDKGVARNLKDPVKVLGRGELDIPLVVEAHKFSKSAREKIEAAGGSVRVID
jgi:large subunit ribosomal protein L15